MDPMLGKMLSHYRIVEQIGAGGMGVVYRVRDENLQRDVALKVLPPHALEDEAAQRRFRKEALALSKLNHPRICTVHDFASQDGVDFLVMEYVEGETLEERLTRGPQPEPEILRLGTQMAHGLAAAHAHGVLHRDLKPANLRITPEGDVKILDFGLAQLARVPAQTTTATETWQLAGTLPYMAPEQLLGRKGDARSDIYSLGVVLYQMATGRRPFTAASPAALAHDIAYTAPKPPREHQHGLSEGLERIILCAMEKDPWRRYQTASDLGADLERGTPTAAVSTRMGVRPWWSVVTAVVLGVAVALVAIFAVILNVPGARDRFFGPSVPAALQSLAVLPLVNLSRDPEQEYFSDGLTEELIGSLAQVSSLRVISRGSVMMLNGANLTPGEIAERLGVNHLVEGSVLRAGDRVKVSAELIGFGPERVLWAKSFEGEVRDLLTLQTDLSESIVQEIRARLTQREQYEWNRAAAEREYQRAIEFRKDGAN